MTKKPGAQQVKKEKRDLHIEPAPAGRSRRLLTFLGTGLAALVVGDSGILAGWAKGEEGGAANEGSPKEGARAPVGGDGNRPFFEPIEPSISQLLSFSGGIPLLLEIDVCVKLWETVVRFLLRTAIAIPIIAVITYLIF